MGDCSRRLEKKGRRSKTMLVETNMEIETFQVSGMP